MGIEQVTQITALGVVINDHMTATDHVTALLTSCSKLLYALGLRVHRAHGLSQQSLMDVFRATVESKIQYAAPAWSGFCTSGDRERLNAFLRRCVKLGYRDKSAPLIEDIFGNCDEQLSQGLTPAAFIYPSSTCLIVLLLAILSHRGDIIKHL